MPGQTFLPPCYFRQHCRPVGEAILAGNKLLGFGQTCSYLPLTKQRKTALGLFAQIFRAGKGWQRTPGDAHGNTFLPFARCPRGGQEVRMKP